MFKTMMGMMLMTGQAMANYAFPAPSLVELHILKNDGIPSHEKYICVNRPSCVKVLNAIKYRYPNLGCATKVFMKQDGRVYRIK